MPGDGFADKNGCPLKTITMELIKIAIIFVIATLLVAGCKETEEKPKIDYSDQGEIDEIETTAREKLELKLDKVERSGSEKNFLGLKSESIIFSQRLDSRTYIVHDLRYGSGKPAGIYEGSDLDLENRAKEILKKLEIPTQEIGEQAILQENTQAAQKDTVSGEIKIEEPQKGRMIARFTRQVEMLPVFSSGLSLGLTKNKEIGFMELHWPEIPKHIVIEAHRLDYKVENGWQPPKQKGAVVGIV